MVPVVTTHETLSVEKMVKVSEYQAMKIQVRGKSEPGSFKNESTGQTFHWKSQKALLFFPGNPFPTKFSLNLHVDEPDYQEGVDYEMTEECFTVDERGRLGIARNLALSIIDKTFKVAS